MNPELELFLERAFEDVQPTTDAVGRVVVEPDYEAALDTDDEEDLAEQLTAYLQQLTADEKIKTAPDGFEAAIGNEYSLLKKYLRKITLHTGPVDGPWIEVEPPGNWI